MHHLTMKFFAVVSILLATLVDGQMITTNKTLYAPNEPIVISWSYTSSSTGDWIGLYPATATVPLPSGSTMWVYVRSLTQRLQSGTRLSGSVSFDSGNPIETGLQSWPLSPGSYKVHVVRDVSAPYPVVASSATFTVGGSAPPPTTPVPTPTASPPTTVSNPACTVATTAVSSVTHLPPNDGMTVSKLAFSSCYKSSSQSSATLWQHVRSTFGNDSAWVWLGDNMYADTDNQNTKRQAYNTARNDQYYSQYGPVANPKIPTTGTWDGTTVFFVVFTRCLSHLLQIGRS